VLFAGGCSQSPQDDQTSEDIVVPEGDADAESLDLSDDTELDGADEADAADSDSSDTTSSVDVEDVEDVTPVVESCRPEAGGDRVEAVIGAFTVVADTASGAWSVLDAEDRAVMVGPSACGEESGLPLLRVATGEPLVVNQFGAFQVATEGRATGIVWAAPDGEVRVNNDVPGQLTIEVQLLDGTSSALQFTEESGGALRLSVPGSGTDGPAEFAFQCREDEAFFGLGTQVTGMDLRGRKYPLWTQEQGIGKTEGGTGFPLSNALEAAYAPMGIWHSTAGYSAMVGHDAWSEIDLCSNGSAGSLRSFGQAPSMVLMPGADGRERMRAITERTGRISAPAPWTFAPWNDAVGGEERVQTVAALLRDNNVPSSAIWSEDWIGGSQTGTGFRLSYAWEWSRDQYPDLPGLIERLHRDGFAFLAYFNTFVPTDTRMYTEGVEGGFLVRSPTGDSPYLITDPAFRQSALVDLTNPASVEWMGSYMRTAADLGIDGWMADFTEWMPVDASLASGQSGWEYHNLWPLDFQRLNTRILTEAHESGDEPPNNFSYFARSGWASFNGGSAGIIPTLWGGDQNTDWQPDDGIPSVVPIAVHAGLSGIAIFGSDIAGYSSFSNPNTTKELFFRWASLGALHPLMRTHHGSDKCDNWSLDRDDESLQHFARWARVHTRLYPVFATLAVEAQRTGLPLTRHPWLTDPNSSALWSADAPLQFLIGDNLLVSPVVAEGATTQRVRTPGAGWWPMFGSAPISGERLLDRGEAEWTMDVAVTELPVLVRPGSALVLLSDAPDTFYPSTNPEVRELNMASDSLSVALYPGVEGTASAVTEWLSVDSTGYDGTWSASEARVNGIAVAGECADGVAEPCYVGDVVRAVADEGGQVTIVDGTLSITVTTSPSREVHLSVGGAVWGDDAIGAGNVDLASAATGWCTPG
jgi:alpha-glucosidase (family GH31 glycosyl hydrolase)